jgi:hypothetical protein
MRAFFVQMEDVLGHAIVSASPGSSLTRAQNWFALSIYLV